MKKSNLYLVLVLGLLAYATSLAQDGKLSAQKTFIDYFQPTPQSGSLSTDVWGADVVGPRDPKNGLESDDKQWNYWDGHIIKASDGKYHLFGSRWGQASGFGHWPTSQAVHAVSANLFGPYVDKGLCWPDNQGGRGHNVTALVLPDGRYAIVVSETRPGDVFVSNSLDGPWVHLGTIQVADGPFKKLGKMSNVAVMVRPDGNFEIIARSGAIWISKNGILGPYEIQGPCIYPKITGLKLQNLEDPVIWYSGGFYHIIVNSWSSRKAYHLTSVDGINAWKYQGLAYDPTANFIRYTDGTINHWSNLERSSVFLENGHIVALTLAATDLPKGGKQNPRGAISKILVLPFNGAALDRDTKP